MLANGMRPADIEAWWEALIGPDRCQRRSSSYGAQSPVPLPSRSEVEARPAGLGAGLLGRRCRGSDYGAVYQEISPVVVGQVATVA